MKRLRKSALVTGAGGFIGGHLIKLLKDEGYFVRGADQKLPDYSKSFADEFLRVDLRIPRNAEKALARKGGFDEVYNLAADRGGAGYMEPGESAMMANNALIDINMISEAVKLKKLPKFFYSSSVCVYRDMELGAGEIKEEDVYPAFPDNEYGWEKLYAERMLQVYGKKFNMPIRIARFHTTYGPEAHWEGGREKAADALCRKVAMARDGESIEVWGDGKAVRCFTYVADLLGGIRALMKSEISEPTNIGSGQYVTVNELAETVVKVSGKKVKIKHTKGPVGVASRNFSNKRIYSTGWRPKYKLADGISILYPWVLNQVEKKYGQSR